MKKVLNVLGKRLLDAKAPLERTIIGLPCPVEPTRPSVSLIEVCCILLLCLFNLSLHFHRYPTFINVPYM